MRRIVVHRPGGFDKLRLETEPDPVPGPGTVHVTTRSIGVNYADCVVRMGLYSSAREFVGFPITPGFEFSGVVAEVGAGVTDFRPGDTVMGVTQFGAYASAVVVPQEQLVRLPPELGMVEAGGFSVAFLTAWYAVLELCRLSPGDRVLVHSAAGGVGSAIVKLARAAGCEVLGVVGAPHKVDVARAAGATAVVDKSGEDLWAAAKSFAPTGFRAVFDANGAATLAESYRHLAPRGRLIVYGFHSLMSRGGLPNPFRLLAGYLKTPRFHPMKMVDRNVGVLAFNLSYLFGELPLFHQAMEDLFEKLRAGVIRPSPVTEFPLERVADAHRALQSASTVGKLVLIP
ncbi:MAG TPA: zinc-binding dehydrogenase [Polyangiaceae bacterium]|nr:zinc-binding dehydrogenase [Polyangiaceae bacterium]